MTLDPASWFSTFAGNDPYPWQDDLLRDESCPSRLIRIPTGFGKTLGVVGTWAFHRAVRRAPSWPRRLVYCLPMRVLVEQTVDAIHEALDRSGLLRSPRRPDGVGVHCLMGGADAEEWHLDVEADAVLVGTQDMLLSRALNRGYAAGRARWPVEFGLLHQDALWVLDEVQLMDVGLATSAQLETYRAADFAAGRGIRPASTWWLSATLQRSWLRSVDSAPMVDALAQVSIPAPGRKGHLWDDVSKPVRTVSVAVEKKADLPGRMAREAAAAWRASSRDGLTIVVVNTVERATAVFQALQAELRSEAPPVDLRLVHSRFRPAERAGWREEFLRRDSPTPEAGRIVVATQVIEAGVDLDARLLVTELAPWPSLVQRFGRAARTGGNAEVVVLDPDFKEDRESAPYPVQGLASARAVLAGLADVSPLSLERFEEAASPEQLEALYPYDPPHLLLRREVDDLFDTTPDLTGADLDISRYIRSGDERDCTIAWVGTATDKQPGPGVQPGRESLCPVPFLRARTWLFGEKGESLLAGKRAWFWDFLDGSWRRARRSDVVPGRTLLVDCQSGGYDALRGFDPASRSPVPPVEPVRPPTAQDLADASQDGEALSESPYKTIATHGAEVAAEVDRIAAAAGLDERHRYVLHLAARWHDLGKAHPAFQGSIRAADRPERSDLAKAPDGAWSRAALYEDPQTRDRRRGFRHELASALGLFAVLETHRPGHPALLGPWHELLDRDADGQPGAPGAPPSPSPTRDELDLLSIEDGGLFDLIAYLVASHHGKVRMSLHAAPADQDYEAKDGRGLPVRGVREGDVLPPTALDPSGPPLPALPLSLEPAALGLSERTGRSWTDRVLGLLATEGPFALAYLEACLRAADVRASRLSTPDPLLAAQEEA